MEFFINMKDIPKKGSPDYDAFWQREIEKIQYGVTIDGYYFHGWLYWHLNHFKIMIDELDPNDGTIIRKFTNPHLRDNEELVSKYLQIAEKEKKGLCIVGTRRFGKSIIEASFVARSATIYEGSENVVVGNNKDDLGVLTALIDKGLTSLHEYLRFPRITDNWKQEVTLGFKDKQGTRFEWSKIFIRNTDGGTTTEVVAGTTPKTLIFDEIGKAKMLEVFAAARPSFESPFGWRAICLFVGTGGDFTNGQDAEKLFNDPETYNMVSMDNGDGKKTCVFVPGTYALAFPKVETTLGDYLGIENKDSELYLIKYYYSTHEENRRKIEEEREKLFKAKDGKELLKYKMYFPLLPEECFLTETGNDFPIEAAKQHLDYLERNPKTHGTPVKLFRGVDGKVTYEEDYKRKPITDYPHNKGDNLDAPVVIWEPPLPGNNDFLYIAGQDPYNQNTSVNSESLGSTYIFKRMYDPVGGTFQNRIVAAYVARPNTMNEWHETSEMLLELYNATSMIENAGTNFIQYMDSKNKGHYLADGFSLLKEISFSTSIGASRNKGLPPTPAVIKHCMNLLVEYCKEEIQLDTDENGAPIMGLGIVRITDPVLLKEIIAYRKGANVDRIVAFRHVLAYDAYLQKIYATVNVKTESSREVSNKPKIYSPFIQSKFGPF